MNKIYQKIIGALKLSWHLVFPLIAFQFLHIATLIDMTGFFLSNQILLGMQVNLKDKCSRSILSAYHIDWIFSENLLDSQLKKSILSNEFAKVTS